MTTHALPSTHDVVPALPRPLLAAVAALFLLDCAWVIWQYGYLGFYAWAWHNGATRLMLVDLSLSLALLALWMLTDARRRGARVLPYLLVTLLLGVAGPLLYLLARTPARPHA